MRISYHRWQSSSNKSVNSTSCDQYLVSSTLSIIQTVARVDVHAQHDFHLTLYLPNCREMAKIWKKIVRGIKKDTIMARPGRGIEAIVEDIS